MPGFASRWASGRDALTRDHDGPLGAALDALLQDQAKDHQPEPFGFPSNPIGKATAALL
jgi:hypothetical protein